MKLDERAFVDERLHDGVDVVRAASRLRHERPEVDVSDRFDIEGALMAEERCEAPSPVEGLLLAVGGDVDDPAASPVRL